MKKSLFVVGLSVALLGLVATSVKADWQIDAKGNLATLSVVLGDTTETPEPKQTPEPVETPEVKDSPEPSHSPEASQEKNQGDSKFEVENSDGKMVVKTHTKDAKTGKEVQTETQFKPGEALQVESQTNAGEHFTVNTEDSTGLSVTNGGQTVNSALPISVNDKNELTVTTPSGSKVVTVLPDQAVAKLRAAGVLTTVKTTPTTTGSGAAVDSVGTLATAGGDAVYNIEGTKQVRFLGLFPVSLNRQVQVSATDGSVVSTAQSAVANFISLFSF